MRVSIKWILSLVIVLGLNATAVFASQVNVLSIKSSKMDREIPATLILPDAYAAESSQRFPVLYMLHGAGGNHAEWNNLSNIAELADQYGIIVLCPDGGVTSWYFDSPIDPTYQYESFVAKECVKYMDKNYRTKAKRDYRALCGLSMGGHGAMFLAIRHRDTFGTAVALSGGVDIRPFPDNWDIKKRLGTIEENKRNWEKYTVINLARDLKDGELAIVLDCGDNDFFLGVNRALHEQLNDDGISHKYEEHSGVHNWDYWREAIKRQMPFIAEHLKAQP